MKGTLTGFCGCCNPAPLLRLWFLPSQAIYSLDFSPGLAPQEFLSNRLKSPRKCPESSEVTIGSQVRHVHGSLQEEISRT